MTKCSWKGGEGVTSSTLLSLSVCALQAHPIPKTALVCVAVRAVSNATVVGQVRAQRDARDEVVALNLGQGFGSLGCFVFGG